MEIKNIADKNDSVYGRISREKSLSEIFVGSGEFLWLVFKKIRIVIEMTFTKLYDY